MPFADVNGTRLHYEVAGEGPPVVFVHGLGLDMRMWDDQFDVFARRYRVMRYDLRGFGKSAPQTEERFLHAEDLRALMDHLEAPKANVIGLSLGGMIALQFALLFSDALWKLVLVDAALDGFEWSGEWEAAYAAIRERAAQQGASAANQMWMEHDLFAPARERPECRSKLAQMVTECSGWTWVNKSTARGIRPPSAERLGEILAPTLVLVGERDLPDFQRIANKLTAEIPAARKVEMKGVGHMSNMENAELFNTIVNGFLSELDSR
ncbi:MAG TPA: alpha/beta fold hydrolase [Candidatus Rubrimentiphilum sp.]|nr:alpha/beta fold hydrolase [Candidatus Rubrimentiphilum sp.]